MSFNFFLRKSFRYYKISLLIFELIEMAAYLVIKIKPKEK